MTKTDFENLQIGQKILSVKGISYTVLKKLCNQHLNMRLKIQDQYGKISYTDNPNHFIGVAG